MALAIAASHSEIKVGARSSGREPVLIVSSRCAPTMLSTFPEADPDSTRDGAGGSPGSEIAISLPGDVLDLQVPYGPQIDLFGFEAEGGEEVREHHHVLEPWGLGEQEV
jgi:hypothetical protein